MEKGATKAGGTGGGKGGSGGKGSKGGGGGGGKGDRDRDAPPPRDPPPREVTGRGPPPPRDSRDADGPAVCPPPNPPTFQPIHLVVSSARGGRSGHPPFGLTHDCFDPARIHGDHSHTHNLHDLSGDLDTDG